MFAHDRTGNREAKPRAARVAIAARFAPAERFEHRGHLFGRDAGALVLDRDHRHAALPRKRDLRRFAIAQRVADQVAQRAPQPRDLGGRHQPLAVRDGDGLAHILELLDHAGDQRG